ncbi:MAG TPA: CpXC domain-containing protein [Methanocorpusculum sp.]|nr:CpXC domain-containing protein [Methanocorpusculum sp.]
MKPEVKIIRCPKCGSRQEFTMYPSITASSNPELKEQFLNGKLTTITCDSCGFSGVVEYPMLYHDLDDKFSIYFKPDSDERKVDLPNVLPAHLISDMKLRLVHNQDDFREKIYIFRDKLDDRIIEVVKDSILREMEAKKEANMPDALYYAEDMFTCDQRSLIFVPRKGTEYLMPIKIPYETYDKVKMMMHHIWDRMFEGYAVVDKELLKV